MLRLVGIQRNEDPRGEFLLLQNQGHMRVLLRGHLVMSESAFLDGDVAASTHLFRDEEHISPGLFVLLSTSRGAPHWTKTKDGAHVYHTYMNLDAPVWQHTECPIHVMAAQHSFVARAGHFAFR